MSSHPQPVPHGRRAVDARHLPNPVTLPLQLQRAHPDVGLVDYHTHHARDYSSHLAQPHRRRPSLLSEFQPGNERGQDQHIRFEHIYLPEPPSQSEVDYAEIKRPRLDMGPESLVRTSSHRQPLPLGGAEDMSKERGSAIGKLEPISPVSPVHMDADLDLVPARFSKEELVQNMERVDREISMVEQQICKLRKKQQQLEEEAAKPHEPERPISPPPSEAKHRSLVQIIYDENRKKAEEAHRILEGLGPRVELPLYNQPSDTKQYHDNIKINQAMRKKLILYFKRRNHARKQWEQKFCQRYDQLMEAWEKKVERIENNPRRRAKESKVREYYEKQFPEIRKQREMQERMQSRVGQRGGGLTSSAARSEHEVSEIIDGISEHENTEKQMRQLAVIPPMLFDAEQQRIKFINMNGLMDDPMKVYKDRQVMNMWSEQEKDTFREKFIQHPKNFGLIASFLERKTVAECVLFYYLTKKNENYKNIVRRNIRRRGRSQHGQQQQQQQHFLQQQQMQKQVLQHQNQQVVPHQQQTTALPPQLQQPPHISQLFGHEPGQDIPQDGFLLGCVFAVADYPEQMADKQLLATWKRVIQACGGVVDPTLTSRCTHLLCESQVSNMYVQALREGKRCVTAHWLSTVLKKKKMVPPRRTLHLPFAFPPGAKPCSQHIISVTGFVDADRDDLKLMTYLAGARYTGYLCRSNTVLICKESSGLKYEKAKEWKIPCVNAQWLCDILLGNFEALRQIQHSRYSIFTHPEPLAPNPQLVHNLLAAWRSPVKVTSEALSNLQLLQRQKISDSTNAPANKKARMEEIQSPSKRIPPESAPQVMFTGFEPMQVQQYTKRLYALGGDVADSSQKATHLMATKVTRTIKFLTAMSRVKYIITPEWLEESWRSQKFVDEVPYTLRDAEAEVLFGFSLEEALKKAHDALLFKGKYFYLTPGICPSLSTMKAILESAGGKLLAKQPSYRKIMEHKQNKNLPEIILVSCDNDLHLCREYFMRNIDVHNAEFILTGVLTQKLDYESYKFT
uniref:PAX interacting (With transcription-activation domain) protein 1 n=1 Tax=Nothobranchius kadleci TaxID=1051664 RepID=A0A1A8DTR7_NOTKA